LSFAHLVSALDLITDPGSGRQAQLPAGMTIEKRYGRLVFSLPSDEPREALAEEVAVHLPGRTVLAMRRMAIECTIEDVGPADIARLRSSATRLEEFLDYDAVARPLTIRGPRRGERFTPLGAPGTKKVSEFLIDNKVDPRDRERAAVLCDRLGLVWLIGHRIDDRVKLTGLTGRVLHLRATFLPA
jgi:tRNA(Ile)-lysidine synthase